MGALGCSPTTLCAASSFEGRAGPPIAPASTSATSSRLPSRCPSSSPATPPAYLALLLRPLSFPPLPNLSRLWHVRPQPRRPLPIESTALWKRHPLCASLPSTTSVASGRLVGRVAAGRMAGRLLVLPSLPPPRCLRPPRRLGPAALARQSLLLRHLLAAPAAWAVSAVAASSCYMLRCVCTTSLHYSRRTSQSSSCPRSLGTAAQTSLPLSPQ
mmetsp:Transcript_32746/g.65177  ORF Transcript_32746/g.65177 Transcript_32746/m.65177 type:complete len:214 (+) Transcript_32746:1591-2232(+)